MRPASSLRISKARVPTGHTTLLLFMHALVGCSTTTLTQIKISSGWWFVGNWKASKHWQGGAVLFSSPLWKSIILLSVCYITGRHTLHRYGLFKKRGGKTLQDEDHVCNYVVYRWKDGAGRLLHQAANRWRHGRGSMAYDEKIISVSKRERSS